MATPPASVVIHHIDDEWTVEWIPGSLFDFCREHYPDMTEDDYSEESLAAAPQDDSDIPTVVRITVRDGAHVRTVEYRRYDLVDFDLRAIHATTDDVIILDLGVVHPDREVTPDGVGYLLQALTYHARQRIFVLTGYQNLLPREVASQLPAGHVFYKPTDAVQFIGAIARAINLAE